MSSRAGRSSRPHTSNTPRNPRWRLRVASAACVVSAALAVAGSASVASAAYPCGTDISSSTSVTPATRATSGVGSVRFEFSTVNNVSNASPRVEVTFPAGFDLTGGVSVSNASGIAVGTASVSGQVVTIPATAQIATGAKAFTLGPIGNPSAVGSYDIDIEVRDQPGCKDSARKAVAVTGVLSGVSVTPANLNAGVTGTASVDFTTGTSIAAGSGQVVLRFPDGFDVSAAAFVSESGLGASGSPTTTVSGQVVTVGLGNAALISPGTKQLVLGGVRNPVSGGTTGTFEVLTADAYGYVDSGDAPAVTIAGEAIPPEVASFTSTTSSPTSDLSATWSLAMSESVSGLTTSDISVAGTSSGWSVASVAGLGSSYTVTLAASSPTSGTVYPVLAVGSVVDAFGNAGPTSPANGAAITYRERGGGGGGGGSGGGGGGTDPGATLPGAPRNAVVAAGDGAATVSWQRPTGAGANSITGYVATATPGGATCTTAGLSCTIPGLANGTTYSVTVIARSAAGSGPATSAGQVTPRAAVSAVAGRKNSTDNRPRPRITLCHATRSETNPYVVITVDPNSVISRGHDQHQDDRDIIPAFTYEENGQSVSFPGQNLTPEGIALLANGCTPSSQTSVAAALIEASKRPPVKSRVTLCHATSSSSNPYVRITVAPEAVSTQGHDQHQDGRDIIPPFSYDDDGTVRQYPGKNWDSESQAIFDNRCRPVAPETGPASLGSTVTYCQSVGGGQYVRSTATVREMIGRDPGADIVPAFAYTDGGTKSFPGANWSSSARSVLDAGCVAPIPTTPTAPVEPVVTCINMADDGSFQAVFGYRNPSAVAVNQPVGPSNAIGLDAAAQGAVVGTQPTRFLPGAVDAAVLVSGVSPTGAVSWTLATVGATLSATATGASPRCPQPATTPEVSVRAECVIDAGNGTYAARFGYQSDEATPIPVPLGPLNTVTQSSGGLVAQTQPTSLSPGVNGSAFTVSGVSVRRAVTWRVVTGGTARTATASIDSLPSCFAPAVPPPGSTPATGGPTSRGDVPPYRLANPGPGGNVTCEQIGYAKSSGRINYADSGFAAAFARQGLTVGVISGTYVTWSSPFPVGAVIVKGGPRANVYEYVPGRVGDSGLASPVNASGNPAGLSNLTMCWNPGAPGPDPEAPTTNPEGSPTPAPPPGTPPGTEPPPSPLTVPEEPEAIGVTVACVKKNTDGSYDAVFGYSNPNPATVGIAAGPANYVAESPGDAGNELRGQVTSFLPGTTTAAFTVTGVPAAKAITWTVAHYGTREATADINFPVACGFTRLGSPLKVSGDPPSTPTPPYDPGDPTASIPVPPEAPVPSPATAQLGVFVTCATVMRRSYSATFGYVNPAGAPLEIAPGPGNRIIGARSFDRGQPGVFSPGTDAVAFTVRAIPIRSRPSWRVTLPNGEVVVAIADPAAPRCSATSRAPGPGIATTITTPRTRPARAKLLTKVSVSNPGVEPLYDVTVTIPTPGNTSRPTRVRPPAGVKCATTARRTACTFSRLMPGSDQLIRLTSIARATGTRFPLARAAGLAESGAAVTAVSSTPLTVVAGGPQPVTG